MRQVHYLIVNEFINDVQGERLSEEDSIKRVCDSLTSRGNLERWDRRILSAMKMVIKVTELVLNEITCRLGVSLRQSEDTLIRNMLASTASFINCTAGINGDNPTNLTRPDIDDVILALLGNNAATMLDHIDGEDKFGTAPTRDAYFALCHTNLTKAFDSVNGFIAKAQYPSQMNVLRSEWGSISNLRFLVSSIGSITYKASEKGKNVYNIFCVGLEAYAVIDQDRYSSSFIYRPPMFSDPLAQNASVGYKYAQVPRICNDSWLYNLRCTIY
jgi:N4-gp56 family major capsid protein